MLVTLIPAPSARLASSGSSRSARVRVTVGAKTPRRRSSSSDVSNRRHVARDARDDPRDDADDENAPLARRPHRASVRVAIPRVARCR